ESKRFGQARVQVKTALLRSHDCPCGQYFGLQHASDVQVRVLPSIRGCGKESHASFTLALIHRGGCIPMHDSWKDMFVLAVPLLEKILRPIFVYAFLVISLRLSGKRELVQLNPFDLVVLLTLSNTVQNAIIGDDNTVTGGVIGATSLLVINYLVVRFLYKHRSLDQLVEGKADILIEDGKVRTQHLKKELITMAQLEAAARKQGFDSLSEVQQCVLEPGGTISF